MAAEERAQSGEDARGVILAWIEAHGLPGTGRPLTRDTPLLEEVRLDSLQILELVDFLESRFGICIDAEELVPENFETVNHVTGLVERVRAG